MILYINCCARKDSRTNRLAKALLNKLGAYEEVNLYDIDIKSIDEERLNKRYELLNKNDLDNEEFKLARQFAKADKIVIAAPFWDLSFPSKLKVYIENIYITGITSKYSEEGKPVGLCKGSDLYYVTTSGGPFNGSYSFEYIKSLCMACFGIKNVKLIKAEMLDVYGYDSEAILNEAINNIEI